MLKCKLINTLYQDYNDSKILYITSKLCIYMLYMESYPNE